MSVWGSTDNSRGYYSGQASMKSHIGFHSCGNVSFEAGSRVISRLVY